MRQKRFAVILAGCGNKDGAEIQESVLTLLAIDQAGHTYQCFAPDVPQARVLNFLTNEPMPEQRNVLLESARIARSQIRPLSEFQVSDFDILVLPGGAGVAYNLCSYAIDGVQMTVHSDVVRAVTQTYQAQKPIGALCIAPVIVGKLIPGVELTFGKDENANSAFQAVGVHTRNTGPTEVVVDRAHKVVSTPCYMISNARISELAEGIRKLIQALLDLG